MSHKIIVKMASVVITLTVWVSIAYGWNGIIQQQEERMNGHLSNWMKDRTFSIQSPSDVQLGRNESSAAIQSSIPGVPELKSQRDSLQRISVNLNANYREFLEVDHPQFQKARVQGQISAGVYYGSKIVLDGWSAFPTGKVANVASNALSVGGDLALNRGITGGTGVLIVAGAGAKGRNWSRGVASAAVLSDAMNWKRELGNFSTLGNQMEKARETMSQGNKTIDSKILAFEMRGYNKIDDKYLSQFHGQGATNMEKYLEFNHPLGNNRLWRDASALERSQFIVPTSGDVNKWGQRQINARINLDKMLYSPSPNSSFDLKHQMQQPFKLNTWGQQQVDARMKLGQMFNSPSIQQHPATQWNSMAQQKMNEWKSQQFKQPTSQLNSWGLVPSYPKMPNSPFFQQHPVTQWKLPQQFKQPQFNQHYNLSTGQWR